MAALVVWIASIMPMGMITVWWEVFRDAAVFGLSHLPQEEGGGSGLDDIIETIYDEIRGAFRVMALLGFTVAGFSFFASPILPDWNTQNRGFIMKGCALAIFVGFLPTFLTWLFGIGA